MTRREFNGWMVVMLFALAALFVTAVNLGMEIGRDECRLGDAP